jgi:Mg2+-importing ATPase
VAPERLARVGPNEVRAAPAAGAVRQFLKRLVNPLNFLLLALAGVSLFTGNVQSVVIIALMVLLSITLGWVQEHRSGRAAQALRAMVHTTASVLRRGGPSVPPSVPESASAFASASASASSATWGTQELPISQLVPGDVVHLSAGDLVPADVRLLSARDFFVNESALTGESLPVEKHALVEAPGVAVLALRNMGFMGTHVASGTATAVVVHTGERAVFGGIAQSMMEAEPPSSFALGVNSVSWLLIRFMLVMVPVVLLINGLTKGDWVEASLFALAVAVGLTPEMLPMIVSSNLAKGAIAMSRRKVIVKRLNAIQNFGAMDVLCTDKTGTLTQDRIILEKYVDLNGEPSDQVLDFAYLNSYYQSGLKTSSMWRCSSTPRCTPSCTRRGCTRRSTRSRSTSSAGACRWWCSAARSAC